MPFSKETETVIERALAATNTVVIICCNPTCRLTLRAALLNRLAPEVIKRTSADRIVKTDGHVIWLITHTSDIKDQLRGIPEPYTLLYD